ncbi:MAG: hypothetical protein RLZZ303_399 [Candidatus Hydrogenedentota bacterium]|jgi:hypothetical protein
MPIFVGLGLIMAAKVMTNTIEADIGLSSGLVKTNLRSTVGGDCWHFGGLSLPCA